MKRVLLTGGAGFIGRHAPAALQALGFEVHAVSRSSPVAGAITHQADLLDPAQAAAVVAATRPTHLLHLAWYAAHGRFWTAPENFRWVGATLALLEAFTTVGGRRAVIAGTCAEYAWNGQPCDELTTPLTPRTEYGECKHATRALSQAWCRQAGASFAWGRLFHLYGPGEHPARLAASVCRALLRGEPAACTAGTQQRDFLHAADAASAFAALLDSPVEGAVNIASGHTVTLAHVVGSIGRLAGREDLVRLGALPMRPDDPAVLVPSTSRLRSEVGWRPRYDLETGLAETLDWWRAHP